MENQDRIIAESFTVPHIRKVVARLVRRPLFESHERDDLQQELLLHVWRKQNLFDEQRGTAEAFVTMLVTTCVRMMIRARRRAKRNAGRSPQSINTTASRGGGGELPATMLSEELVLEDRARRLGTQVCNVPDQIRLRDQAFGCRAQVPSEHHWFLIHVAERGIAGAARLHGLSRRQAQSVVRRIGNCVISRAAESAAA